VECDFLHAYRLEQRCSKGRLALDVRKAEPLPQPPVPDVLGLPQRGRTTETSEATPTEKSETFLGVSTFLDKQNRIRSNGATLEPRVTSGG